MAKLSPTSKMQQSAKDSQPRPAFMCELTPINQKEKGLFEILENHKKTTTMCSGML